MEKRRASFNLETIQTELGSLNSLRMTRSASRGARVLGFDDQDVVDVITALSRTDFYKSMTTYADHRVWQDVYKTSAKGVALYVKFTMDADGHFLISFKEDGDGK